MCGKRPHGAAVATLVRDLGGPLSCSSHLREKFVGPRTSKDDAQRFVDKLR